MEELGDSLKNRKNKNVDESDSDDKEIGEDNEDSEEIDDDIENDEVNPDDDADEIADDSLGGNDNFSDLGSDEGKYTNAGLYILT